jgi:hypothetical protein
MEWLCPLAKFLSPVPKLARDSSYRVPLPESIGKAAFGQYSEQEADCGPQHRLDAKCCNTEAPQNYGRELFWHFIEFWQHILDDRDDHDECRTGDERRIPRAVARREAPCECHCENECSHRNHEHHKE